MEMVSGARLLGKEGQEARKGQLASKGYTNSNHEKEGSLFELNHYSLAPKIRRIPACPFATFCSPPYAQLSRFL